MTGETLLCVGFAAVGGFYAGVLFMDAGFKREIKTLRDESDRMSADLDKLIRDIAEGMEKR